LVDEESTLTVPNTTEQKILQEIRKPIDVNPLNYNANIQNANYFKSRFSDLINPTSESLQNLKSPNEK